MTDPDRQRQLAAMTGQPSCADETGWGRGRRPVVIDGPLLVFGGPYSNLEAVQAVFDEAKNRGFPARNILCTGDLVAYCADPRDVLRLVRDSGIHVIAGNCEEALVAGADDCGCGFAEGSSCAELSAQWYPFADKCVGVDSRRWMATLPSRLDLDVAGWKLSAVHGGFAQSNRFVFGSDITAIEQELAATDADGVIAGHCGIPFTRVVNDRVWHNAGVIGMPANDGTTRGWFSVVTPAVDGLAFQHHALHYDHERAAAKLRTNNLPEGYARCLEAGIWPSFDILTPEDYDRRGVPLAPGAVTWRPAAAPTG